MNRDEKLALFLGMLSGDGCLSIKYSGEGYRDYPINLCNTDKNLVEMFRRLFCDLFEIEGKIYSYKRYNRKEIWHFTKYSVKVVKYLRSLGFPEGVKRDVLRVLPIINNGTKEQKIAFMNGLIITDGCIKNSGRIVFHLGSKLFLHDVSKLLLEITGIERPVKEFVQREIYKSYQLSLNKAEGMKLLLNMPTWDNGTPTVLS